MEAGTKTKPVHYRGGGDTVKDLLSGEVKVMFSSIAPVQAFVNDGRLIGLATTGPKRDPAFPDLPTIAESGYPGLRRAALDRADGAGRHAARDIIKQLEDANRKALESPEIQKALAAQGFAPMIGTAGGVRRLLPRRARQVGQGHQGVRHGQGVARGALTAKGWQRCWPAPDRCTTAWRCTTPTRSRSACSAPTARRPHRHQGAGALVGELAGLPRARAHGRRGRHRLHAADRPLEGLRRRHRLSRRDARDHDLGLRPAGRDQAHHRVRHRARAAVPSDHRRQGVRHRRPHRRGPLRR